MKELNAKIVKSFDEKGNNVAIDDKEPIEENLCCFIKE